MQFLLNGIVLISISEIFISADILSTTKKKKGPAIKWVSSLPHPQWEFNYVMFVSSKVYEMVHLHCPANPPTWNLIPQNTPFGYYQSAPFHRWNVHLFTHPLTEPSAIATIHNTLYRYIYIFLPAFLWSLFVTFT